MKDYKYQLRKGSKKDVCPNCGKKTFVPYVDVNTNKEAGQEFGKCERINSCAYIKYPKTERDENWTPPAPQPYIAPKPTEYISKEIVEKTFSDYRSNVFFQYLRKTFGDAVALQLREDYNIATAKNGGTIFWQQDNVGRFRTGKVMYYGENGKRLKDKLSWFVHKNIRPDFNFQQCFFGLHLVTAEKPVALCESEKTAVLMSIYEPKFTWVASGGSEMINVQRITELKRLDKVYPDGGQFEKWEQKTKLFESRQMDISVDAAIANGLIPEGSDILDLTQKTILL